VEWVAALLWNQWQHSNGICKLEHFCSWKINGEAEEWGKVSISEAQASRN